ncbi:MAG: winged helix-turn-helix domain-containing protein [Candidatus Acidiferrales bacterium]|jgi:DNA-binding winged helix-turn-helix (wHTH) protein/TolB-like protein
MSLQCQPFYEFGPYSLEPAERLLLRSGKSIPLPPKAFDALLLLVQNRGHVLSKDQLMSRLWPNTFVEENNLTQHISMLRRALGEGPGETDYIETVPKLGYRFVMPVREISGNGDTDMLLQRHTRTHIVIHEQEEEDFTDAGWWRHKSATARKWIVVSAGAAALAIAGFILLRSSRISFQPSQPRTLAVLPLRDLKPDKESQFIGYSLADAIINRLGYVSEIVVRPSSYMVKYRDGDVDPRVVAKELHVQTVLMGNYIKEGDRLRVSVELVDVASSETLWHETLDLHYQQLLTVQDQVAENVISGMRLRILPQEAQRLKQSVPKNPLAYEYFLRAEEGEIPNNFRLSMQLFEKSVALDPDYAPAWAKLAQVDGAYANWQGGGADFMAKSRAAFDKALQLDPDVPHIHTYLAIQMMERGELDQAVLTLREELRRNPNDPQARWWLTEAYLYGGMLTESIAEGEHALQLDPLVSRGSTFNSYLYTGEYDKFLSSLPVEVGARTTFYRGLCFLYMRDPSRAAGEFERAYALDPSLLHAKYGKAFLYAIQQNPAEGVQYLKEIEQETPTDDGEMLYKLGQAYAMLGDRPSALHSLRGAIDHNFYCHACFVRDPLLGSIRGEGEYSDLLQHALDLHEGFRQRYF